MRISCNYVFIIVKYLCNMMVIKSLKFTHSCSELRVPNDELKFGRQSSGVGLWLFLYPSAAAGNLTGGFGC